MAARSFTRWSPDEPGRVAFYGWRDVDFVLWMCTPEARTIHPVGEVIPRRMQAHADRLSVLHVIYPGCPRCASRGARAPALISLR